MKMDLYELFSADAKQPEHTEAIENVRTLTLRKIEQTEAARHMMRRPLRNVLLAAVAAALLASSVFAAPQLWKAITGIEAEQYEQINKIAEEYQVSTAVVARWAITAYLKQDHARQTV